MVSLENGLKVIADLSALSLEIIAIAEKGIGFSSIGPLLHLVGQFKQLANDAKNALPELRTYGVEEDAQLAEAAYEMVKKIIDVVPHN